MKFIRATLFVIVGIIVVVVGLDEWKIYQRFQNEPVATAQAVAIGNTYTEKTRKFILKSYYADLSYRTDPNQPSSTLRDELISEDELEKLKRGEAIEIVYLQQSPEIAAHEGNPRNKMPWEMPALALVMLAAALVVLRKKPNNPD